MKSNKEFILDTLLPYKEDNTKCAFEDDNCLYLTKDGKKCAIGKWMKDGIWQYELGTNISTLLKKFTIEEMMVDEFVQQNLSIELMTEMQLYHDYLSEPVLKSGANDAVSNMEKIIGEDLSELIVE